MPRIVSPGWRTARQSAASLACGTAVRLASQSCDRARFRMAKPRQYRQKIATAGKTQHRFTCQQYSSSVPSSASSTRGDLQLHKDHST